MEFILSLRGIEPEITPSQHVLSYVTVKSYSDEKAYSERIQRDLRMGSRVSKILRTLEEAKWIKRKSEVVDGRRVLACYPTSRGESALERCGLSPYE
jgi:DNA-binding MarR family transcriptional regulator